MAEYDRTARNLDTAYVLSFFFQLAATVVAFVGLVAWAREGTCVWALWLLGGAATGIAACHVLRWQIKRWFRRRWPVE